MIHSAAGRYRAAWVALAAWGGMVSAAAARPAGQPAPATQAPSSRPGPRQGRPQTQPGLVPIPLRLPKPAFKGTPTFIPPGTTVEKPSGKPRPPFLAPPGTRNVARGKPVTSSDDEPIIGRLGLVTDGDKEARAGSYVELGPGVQWVQIDLKKSYRVYAVVVWHYHLTARVYHDVVVQLADDADFITNVRTLFNNDHDNSAGLGLGRQREYWDTAEGKLIDARGVRARYVRLYSNGNIADDMNHYTEVEVYALPAK